MRRTLQPIVRLTTVEPVQHEPVFDEFTKIVEEMALEARVRREPRVVSFPRQRGRGAAR